MKTLIAFDFDHTVIEGNSDVHVQRCAPGGVIPDSIKSIYSSKGWTKYMGSIFKYLHKNGVTAHIIEECMKEIPLVDGMAELFEYLEQDNIDVIIVSDSNTRFIDYVLKKYEIDTVVDKVFTNPAEFNADGCLEIDYYHVQDWCDLSTVNLCKGHILEQYLETKLASGLDYDVVVFVGDGTNDLCPSLRLQEKDYVLPRRGFRLIQQLDLLKKPLRASVVPWTNGFDILTWLQSVRK